MLKKILIALSLSILTFSLVWVYKLIFGKPFSFNHAVESSMFIALLEDPEMLSHLGMLDNTLLDFHSASLKDASPNHDEKLLKMAEKNLSLFKSYELRKFMMKEYGDEFDIKKFHNVILKNGSLPLMMLERVVKDYVEKYRSRN